MRKIIVALPVLLLSLSATAQDRGMTKAEIAQNKKNALSLGKKVVKASLKDPDSAKFRSLTTNKNGVVLCGEVNAKNSYGGYVGFKRFFSIWEANHVSIDDGNEFYILQWKKMCEAEQSEVN